MKIQINNKQFDKSELIKLIAKNKLQVIIHIRNVANIGLKDAKEIVENLYKNPNYYDNSVIKIAEKDFSEKESIILDRKNNTTERILNTHKKFGSHIVKNQSIAKKWMYAIGFALIITLLYLLVIN
ncbi:hypothetical protein LPB136_08155 [Tenacibaculum todarodis]|uniref:Large ribosomal subunit protein bL12 C-terminal domain-containing protein n=1 Tax=Tenacibaculum todarodis TaxID=1850252 RepID=A0A1L3JJJ3_9FLAO|nr:ribosomal protein L7/L12 [Tenacibaculum todarodis]APG65325.1 hypothetical protein LPB136_08155 [Tenacibaculum todarodis]